MFVSTHVVLQVTCKICENSFHMDLVMTPCLFPTDDMIFLHQQFSYYGQRATEIQSEHAKPKTKRINIIELKVYKYSKNGKTK